MESRIGAPALLCRRPVFVRIWIMCRHEDPYIEPEKPAECSICRKILETNQKKKAA